MNLDTWKPLVAQKMQQLGHWLQRQQASTPYLVYGTLTGLSLWPLVEQAAQTGQLAPAIGGLYSVAAGVGANLVANQIEAWKNRADKPTEAEVIAWTGAQANNPEARDFMDEMIKKLDAMQAAQPTLTTKPEWQQQFLDELQRLGNLPRFEAILNAPGFVVQFQGDKNQLGDFHYTHIEKQEIHQTSPPAPDPAEQARKDYLENLIRYCSQLPIAALSGDETTGQELSLTQVYVDLNTTTHIPLTEQEKKQQRERVDPFQGSDDRIVTAWEAAQQHPRLVLLGDPGSGKSSFVRYLAMKLAEDLRKPPNLLRQPPPLLPVLVTLRDLARRLKPLKLPLTLTLAERDKRLMKALWQQWQADLGHYKAALFARDLERVMGRGNVLLILDGLDEVAEDTRERVQQAVFALMRSYPKLAHIIITCRSRSWRSDLFPSFKDYTLAPFTEKQIDQFIMLWYQEQTRPPISRFSDEDAVRRSQDLQTAVRGNDLWKLAGNPMLLTTMALVHQRETKLPDERVKLFTQAVKVLVERWQGQSKEWQVSDSLREWLNQEHRWRPALERLAYEAQTRQANLSQLLSENDQPGDLTVEQIITILRSPAYLGSVTLAGEFLDYVDQRAGLLVGRGGQIGEDHAFAYTFPHRTFQEYLAGSYLISGRRVAGQIRPLAEGGDFWAVTVQLGAEELLYNKRDTDKVKDLAYGLCPTRSPQTQAEWRQLVWSGETAAQLGRDEIERDNEPDGGKHYLERLIPRLVEAMQGQTSHPLPIIERAAAGRHLAVLGDPRPSVGVIVQNGVKIPDIAWGKLVPAGMYTIGGDKDAGESKQKEVRIEQAYQLACYPVTNAQFDCFVEADDFADPRWWAGMPTEVEGYLGERYQLQEMRPASFPWANHPRVGMSWYQAIAFCRWLSDKLGYEVDLPHEWEWEAAARYPDNRFYPWGNEFDPAKANTWESQIGQTTAVGLYPQGANEALGLYDLSGNVWEWCRNSYDDPTDTRLDAPDTRRVVRGGSWHFNQNYARAVYRNHPHLVARNDYLGCRVVRRPPSP